jgi:hypothetical protein
MATRRQFLKKASYGLVLIGGQWVVTEAGAAVDFEGHQMTGDRGPRPGSGHPTDGAPPPGPPAPPGAAGKNELPDRPLVF